MFLCVGTGVLMVGMQSQQIPKFSLPTFQWATSQGISPRPEPIIAVSNAKIVVDLSERRVYLYKDDKLKAKYPVAIGQTGWETPTGAFKVFQMYRNPVWLHPITGQKVPPGKKNPLGKWWIGFSSEEDLLIGFHGTNEEALLGQAVSHGCVRMKNSDVGNLYRQVSIGTPVTVKP